ncbi:MAG: hypothetical protein Q8Q90_00255 [bacterium]|nr:hypothetical protein [bacterium]
MDEISKENILNPDVQDVGASSEVLPLQENIETQIAPETPAGETGEIPTSRPINDQNAYGVEVQEEVYLDEEIQQEVADVAHLPQEEKLVHLKEVAQRSSLEKAIRMVKSMDDPWLEDKFHDELIDDPDFRVKLEELGKIEKL